MRPEGDGEGAKCEQCEEVGEAKREGTGDGHSRGADGLYSDSVHYPGAGGKGLGKE